MATTSPERQAVLAQENLGPLTRSIIIAFTVIAFICVCLRVFTRVRFLGRAIGWEDYTIVISMVMSILAMAMQVLQVDAGNGRHAMFVPFPAGVTQLLKYLFWSILFYNLSLTSTKISILLQYRRIFTLREMRMPMHIVLTICIAWGITIFLVSVFSCVPVKAFWQVLEQANAKCIDNKTWWYVNGGINIATDLLIAALPVRSIWALQIPKQQKIALVTILSIGWFVCVVSILRLRALIMLAAHPEDTTWYGAATAYWSSIEMNLAIVCASLPALKPLIVKVIPGFSAKHSSKVYGTGNSGRHRNLEYGKSKSMRNTVDEELELGASITTTAYPSGSNNSVHGHNIYISRQLEQHYEEGGHLSDSESQKDLVAKPESVLEKR